MDTNTTMYEEAGNADLEPLAKRPRVQSQPDCMRCGDDGMASAPVLRDPASSLERSTPRLSKRALETAERSQVHVWLDRTFGLDWRDLIDQSHHLSVAQPVLYCRTCGHMCQLRQSARALRKPCSGPPTHHEYSRRLRKLSEGVHPITGAALLGRPVPVFRELEQQRPA